jgi:ABC-2 type transport system permease protein
MKGLMHSELAKLLTTRAVKWVVLAELFLVALAESGAIASGALSTAKLETPGGVRLVLEHGGLAAIMSLVIGILVTAGEYRHGTIADTFLSVPRRTPVVVAKLWIGFFAGVLAGILSSLTALVTAVIWYSAKGLSFDVTSASVVRSLIGIVLWHAMYATIGVALGALLRSQAVAIVLAVIWIFVAETAVAQLVVSVGRWLPATAARGLGYSSDSGLLPQLGAGFVLAGWAAVAAVAAIAVTKRRDVV